MNTRIISLLVIAVMLLGSVVLADDAISISSSLTINEEVEVVTAKEIIKEDKLVSYKVLIPKIQGLKDKVFEDRFNIDILKKALEIIEEVEEGAKEQEKMAAGEDWEFRSHSIDIVYSVKSIGRLLSFNIDTYMYTGGANGITHVYTYNIDPEKCAEIRISDLFIEGSDFHEIINKEIISQIKIREDNDDAMFFHDDFGFKGIGEDQSFYIEGDDLVILFQKYEIAPGAMGIQEFKIPLNMLNHILKEKKQTKYLNFTGVVKEITKSEKRTVLWLEDKDGMPVNFVITEDTYIKDDGEIKIGSIVTGFYDSEKPVILIYPPQYNVEVISVVKEGESIKVDRFDENMVSSDNMLKLNIVENTEIIKQDGTAFDGELRNRKLVVFYGASTKSIPAQTTPFRIVVLFEEEIQSIYEFPEVRETELYVNSTLVKVPEMYTNELGNIMLPIRPVCEAMGITVEWDNESRSVLLGNGISLRVGLDKYNKADGIEVSMGVQSEIKNNRFLAPLEFFQSAEDQFKVNIFGNKIEIINK